MERIIEEYLNVKDDIKEPYENHYGHGDNMGYCSNDGRGRAFVSYDVKDNFTGKDILSFNENKLYMINDYLLYITNVHKPWANGEIIKNDLTTQSCYIGRINDKFVISDSLRNAIEELRNVIHKTEDNEKDMAQAFVIAHPCYDKEYNWNEMISWHSIVRETCANGRKNFSEFYGKTNKSTATPKELIRLMRDYGVTRLANYFEEYYLEKEKAS